MKGDPCKCGCGRPAKRIYATKACNVRRFERRTSEHLRKRPPALGIDVVLDGDGDGDRAHSGMALEMWMDVE